MYTSVIDGCCFLILNTTQDEQTRVFPFPKYPYRANTYCLYAAFLKARILLSSGSFLMSPIFLMTSCNISASRLSFENLDDRVTQFFCLKHLFSTIWGNGAHKPHMHESGLGPLPDDGKGDWEPISTTVPPTPTT